MIQDIYIIDNDDNLKNIANNLFKDNKDYRFKKVLTKQIDIALRNIPSLIIINEDNIYSKYIKYSIQIKDTGIMNSEYFKTEQEANDYATKIGLKEDEYSLIQWIKEPVLSLQWITNSKKKLEDLQC